MSRLVSYRRLGQNDIERTGGFVVLLKARNSHRLAASALSGDAAQEYRSGRAEP
jgi:hypothetical protein